MGNKLRVGDVASMAGVSTDAVRYYERLKLLPEARRTGGGYREFDEDAVERVRFIKRAQMLRFSLEEISDILSADRENYCSQVQALLARKLEEIDARLAMLTEFKTTLTGLVARCDETLVRDPASCECPVVQEIEHGQID
jgi:DNA-binding transcriptional MerR regulator